MLTTFVHLFCSLGYKFLQHRQLRGGQVATKLDLCGVRLDCAASATAATLTALLAFLDNSNTEATSGPHLGQLSFTFPTRLPRR